MIRSYRTIKGTELPLLNLRGKEYLEVKYRLVWFREERPTWRIETEFVSVTGDSAFARATIKDDAGNVVATSHKFEDKKGFPDFIEKSETGAIGRALAICGFGTQFCADELDEGERIVDAPVGTSVAGYVQQGAHVPATPKPQHIPNDQDPGEYRVAFGKKFKGQKISEIDPGELSGFIIWCEDQAEKKGLPMSSDALTLKEMFGRYTAPQDTAADAARGAR